MPDRTSSSSSNRLYELTREVLCGCTLAGAFVRFAQLSWRTWPDILVDFGQELYVPWRLASGDVLYRDVAWVTGPLSEYFNALLFRVFGVSLTTLIFANLVLLAAIVGMLYYLFRQCGTRASATSVCLFFLAVFAFGQYSLIANYNYICPYRHDMTHGLILGLLNLICLLRFGQTRRMAWLVSSGLCIGLLSLSKIEMTLAAGLCIAVALPVFAWQRAGALNGPDAKQSATGAVRFNLMNWFLQTISWYAIVAASALLPIAIAVSALARSLGWSGSVQNIFLQYRLVFSPQLSAGSGFYRAIAGTDHPIENVIAMVLAAVIVLAGVIAAYVAEVTFGRSRRAHIWAMVLGIAIAWMSMILVPQTEWQGLAASLPILLVPIIFLCLKPALSDPKGPATVLLLIAVYGIGLLPKILLRVGWGHYGFVLAMPGTLVLIHVALHTIPALWQSQRQTGSCFRAVTGGLIVACAISLTYSWIRIDVAKTVVVGDQGDLFYSEPRYDGRSLPTVKTLDYLKTHLQPDDTLIVFPNGVMLNYLLRKRNPTPYIMFNPWESDVHGGEDHIADTIIKAAPDYAVIVTMDSTIHGRGNFGDPEFGGRIRKFLDEHYTIVDEQMSTGGMEGGFASTVFKRRE